MFRLVITLLSFVLHFSFRLRYRFEVKGIDRIRQRSGEGIIFLASYSSILDPIFISSLLIMDGMDVRVVAYENEYRKPIIGLIIRWLRGISVPDLSSSSNFFRKQRSEFAFRKISQAIKMGDVFLIHPSGRPKMTGKESLKGTKWAHRLTQEVPGIRVVLVRVSGLWGSKFSTIWEKKSPNFFRMAWEGFKCIFKNGIFFCPKRQVIISFEEKSEELKGLSRFQFNSYVEKWLNQYETPLQKEGMEEEIPTFVPYTFFSDPVTPSGDSFGKDSFENFSSIPKEIVDPILQEISRITGRDSENFSPKDDFMENLGLDAEQRADLLSWIHKRFGKFGLRDHQMSTLHHLLWSVKQKVELKQERSSYSKESFHFKDWFIENKRVPIACPVGTLIQEAFLRACDRGGNAVACSDINGGTYSYKELKRKVLLFAKEIKYLPGSKIGIMLPASIDATIILFSVLLTGKIPVMMDWNVDNKEIRKAIEISDVNVVITSRWFSDELSNSALEHIPHLLLMIEDIKERSSVWEKIKSHLEVFRTADKLLDEWDECCTKPDNTAVIFFKQSVDGKLLAVPLSHRNVLSNVIGLFSTLPITSQDSILAVIPPFHLISFSLLHIFPICCSIRTFYYPYAFESVQIAVLIEQFKPTVFVGNSSIIQSLLEFANQKELASIRYFFCCGGTLSSVLEKRIRDFGSCIIYGYGTTECGAVVAINRKGLSLGKNLQATPGVLFCIINPETGKILPHDVEGQICMSGDSVFSGYLSEKSNEKNFFIDESKKTWFKTTDFGSLDRHKKLRIISPLSRIVNIEGKAVFLDLLEQQISDLLEEKQILISSSKSGFIISPSIAIYKGNKPNIICLATKIDINLVEINDLLKKQYNYELDMVNKASKITSIPMLESGKIDYSLLEKTL